MGFDISYHPIREQEMETWYFAPLRQLLQGDDSLLKQQAALHELEDFYAQKYAHTLQVAAQTQPEELFDISHGYFLAVVQGFFRTFYYTRGTALSFLMEEHPSLRRYTTSWAKLRPELPNPAANKIVQNYCAGVYLPYEQVKQLAADLEQNTEIQELFSQFFGHNLPILRKALNHCLEEETGLLEATEVVEPNPVSLNDTSCYSNLFHCDTEGPLLYQKTALEQLQEAADQEGIPLEEMLESIVYRKVSSDSEPQS